MVIPVLFDRLYSWSLPNNDRTLLILGFFEWGRRNRKWFWRPVIDQVVNLLVNVRNA